MDRQEVYKINPKIQDYKDVRREDLVERRKSKRQDFLDQRRNYTEECKENQEDSQADIPKVKQNRRDLLQKWKEEHRKNVQKTGKKPFVVGVVRHNVASPVFQPVAPLPPLREVRQTSNAQVTRPQATPTPTHHQNAAVYCFGRQKPTQHKFQVSNSVKKLTVPVAPSCANPSRKGNLTSKHKPEASGVSAVKQNPIATQKKTAKENTAPVEKRLTRAMTLAKGTRQQKKSPTKKTVATKVNEPSTSKAKAPSRKPRERPETVTTHSDNQPTTSSTGKPRVAFEEVDDMEEIGKLEGGRMNENIEPTPAATKDSKNEPSTSKSGSSRKARVAFFEEDHDTKEIGSPEIGINENMKPTEPAATIDSNDKPSTSKSRSSRRTRVVFEDDHHTDERNTPEKITMKQNIVPTPAVLRDSNNEPSTSKLRRSSRKTRVAFEDDHDTNEMRTPEKRRIKQKIVPTPAVLRDSNKEPSTSKLRRSSRKTRVAIFVDDHDSEEMKTPQVSRSIKNRVRTPAVKANEDDCEPNEEVLEAMETDSNECAVDSASRAQQFYDNLERESDLLLKCCDRWSKPAFTELVPQEVSDEMDSTVGQARLLVSDKFQQFKRLIQRFEEGSQPPVTAEDLHGFWDMIYIQVDKMKERFDQLTELKNHNWQKKTEQVVAKKKVASKPKAAKPVVKSRFQEFMAKKKMENTKKSCDSRNATPNKESQSNTDTPTGTPLLDRVKHLALDKKSERRRSSLASASRVLRTSLIAKTLATPFSGNTTGGDLDQQ